MTGLLFTADGQLREQTCATEPRVLSRVAEARHGAGARLVSADAEHEIVLCEAAGSGLALRDGEGVLGGGFQPFRLRCGGRLRVGEVELSLHGSPWSHEGWVFSTPDGRVARATVMAASAKSSPGDGDGDGDGDGRAEPLASAGRFAVELEAEQPLERLLPFADVLALGCWLIERWHRMPPVDHVLASATPAAPTETGFRGSADGVGSAGKEARAAN